MTPLVLNYIYFLIVHVLCVCVDNLIGYSTLLPLANKNVQKNFHHLDIYLFNNNKYINRTNTWIILMSTTQ